MLGSEHMSHLRDKLDKNESAENKRVLSKSILIRYKASRDLKVRIGSYECEKMLPSVSHKLLDCSLKCVAQINKTVVNGNSSLLVMFSS